MYINEVKAMNDLLERYLGAVCSYFFGRKRQFVYQDLKNQISQSAHQYEDMEDLLMSYGHPLSVAYSYGYRPTLFHRFNPHIVNLIEKFVFLISGIYLFFSTLYYLEQFGCLPFQSTNHVVTTMNTSSLITALLSYPILTMIGIIAIAFIILAILDKKYSISQDLDLNWNLEILDRLPHPSHYPNHSVETIFMFIFIIFFIAYAIFFSSDLIIRIQHESYQMIHMMTYFFQPFIMIIIFDYFIDMTKKIYTKKYLKYSFIINLFNIVSLSVFVINSHFLNNYLLPYNMNFEYMLVNAFIIIALCFIYFISLYKLFRNIKSYRSLFKK